MTNDQLPMFEMILSLRVKIVREMATKFHNQTRISPKHEIRNSKQSQMTKSQMFQTGELRDCEF
jgi:hypothetical protein